MICFYFVGYILGVVYVSFDVQGQCLYFSGDLGWQQELLMNLLMFLFVCDVLVCEFIYGNWEYILID